MITSEDLLLARAVLEGELVTAQVVRRLLAQLDTLSDAPTLSAWLVVRGHLDAERTKKLALEARLTVARRADAAYARLAVESGLLASVVDAHVANVGPNAKRLGFRLVAAGLISEEQDAVLLARARDALLAEEAAALERERSRRFHLEESASAPSAPAVPARAKKTDPNATVIDGIVLAIPPSPTAPAAPPAPPPPPPPPPPLRKKTNPEATVLDDLVLPLPSAPVSSEPAAKKKDPGATVLDDIVLAIPPKKDPGATVLDDAVLPLPPNPNARAPGGRIARDSLQEILSRAARLGPKSEPVDIIATAKHDAVLPLPLPPSAPAPDDGADDATVRIPPPDPDATVMIPPPGHLDATVLLAPPPPPAPTIATPGQPDAPMPPTGKHDSVLPLPTPSAPDQPLVSSWNDSESTDASRSKDGGAVARSEAKTQVAAPSLVSSLTGSVDEGHEARAGLRPGDRFAGLTIESVIGRGGMGSVYSGIDAEGSRRAIKVSAFFGDDEMRERFRRETEALGKVPPHPHVLSIRAVGEEQGLAFCVTDLVTGSSLADLVKKGPIPVALALELGEKIALALAHIHEHGVVHRDVKPANIMIRDSNGEPVLIDFGLARAAGSDRLTQTGEVVGSPLYMSPEQVLGAKDEDSRTDIYSLGATLFEILTGEPVFTGQGTVDLMQKVVRDAPPTPSKIVPGISPAVDAIILRTLEKERSERYLNAAVLAQDLELARQGVVLEERPSRLLPVLRALVFASLAVLALALWIASSKWQADVESRAHDSAETDAAVASELQSRIRTAAAALGGEGAPAKSLSAADDAVRAYEGAAAALVKIGLTQQEARSKVEASELATLAARSYVARAMARGPGKETFALEDLKKAAAIAALARVREGCPTPAGLALERARIHLVGGEDERAEAELRGDASDPLVAIELARLQLALGDPRAAAALPLEGAARIRLRLDAALAEGDAPGARARLADLLRSDAPPLEKSLAELEVAPLASASDARTTELAKDLRKRADDEKTARGDAARIEVALAELADRRTFERAADVLPDEAALAGALDATTQALPPGGGPSRALRVRALVLLARVQRRAGDPLASKNAAQSAFDEALAPEGKARAALELARTAFGRGELDEAAAALRRAPPGTRVAGVDSLARTIERERHRQVVKSSIVGDPELLPGPQDDVPGDPVRAAQARSGSREALGVALAARELALGRRVHDPREWLDIDGQHEKALRAAQASGLARWLSREIDERSRETSDALESARERTRPYVERAIAAGRLAVDEDPEHASSLEAVLAAGLSGATTTPDEVRSLVERLLRVSKTSESRLLAARAVLEIEGEAARAEQLASPLTGAGASRLEGFELRARARLKLGNLDTARSDVEFLLQRGPLDATLLASQERSLEALEPPAAVNLVLGARLGTNATEALRAKAAERLVARELAGILAHEKEHPWGVGGAPHSVPVFSPELGRHAVAALGALAALLGSAPDQKAQVLWLRGQARRRMAAAPVELAEAILDLADAAARRQDRPIDFLVEIERISGEPLAKDVEARLALVRDGDGKRRDLASPQIAATLGLAAFAAVRAKHAPLAEKERDAALEVCRQLLEARPGSVVGFLARALVLARADRGAEASTNVAAALAIAPDIQQERDGAPGAGFVVGAH